MDQRVLKIIGLMRANIGSGLSLCALARIVNLSPSRLHQVFKDATGMPPAKYLRQLRMQQAQELLENSFLSVKEIRTRVGFGDESHFVRDFKKVYGVSPTQYRQDHLRAQRVLKAAQTAGQPLSGIEPVDDGVVGVRMMMNAVSGNPAPQTEFLNGLSQNLERQDSEMPVAAVEVRQLVSQAIVIAHRTASLRPQLSHSSPRRPPAPALRHKNFISAHQDRYVTIRRPSPPKHHRATHQVTYRNAALKPR